MPEPTAESAAQMAARLGDSLMRAEQLAPGDLALVAATRELVEAVVATDLPSDQRDRLAGALRDLAGTLQSSRRDPVILLCRHEDGRVENLTQAGTGRLNPQAIPLEFGPLPPAPAPGADPKPVEVTARCTLTAAHGGPPGRIHGGVVTTILDEVLGVAATAAGASGMTGSLTVRFEAATPYREPLEARGRYVRSEGRKHFATGELSWRGEVTARAEATFVAPRPNAG